MKKSRTLFLILCILALAATLAACNAADSPNEEQVPVAVVTVRINPSVELVLDKNDTVMSVGGLNDDALVLLYNEGGLTNVKLNVALKNIIDLAAQYGYATDGQDIYVDSYAASSAETERLYSSAQSAIESAGSSLGLTVSRLEELSVGYRLKKDGYDMTESRYRLAARVAEISDRSVDETATLDDQELLRALNAANSNSDSKLGRAYDLAVQEARFVVKSARQTAKDGLYSVYFINKILNSDSFMSAASSARSVLYSNIYASLHFAELNLRHYYTSLKAYIADPIVTLDDIKAVYEKIKTFIKDVTEQSFIDDVSTDGKIYRKSVDSYVDELYLGADEAQKEAIRAVYDEIEPIIDDKNFAEFDSVSVKQTLKNIIDSITSKLDDAASALAGKDIAPFGNALSKLGEIMSDIYDWLGLESIDFKKIFDVEHALDNLSAATEWAYDEINLTAQDISGVEELAQTISDALEEAEQTFADAIKQAKDSAAKWLDDSKRALVAASR